MPLSDLLSRDDLPEDVRASIRQEMSERASTEAALRESEGRHQSAFRAAADAMLIFDCADLRILDANDAAIATYGYSVEELRALAMTALSAEPNASARSIDGLEEHVPLRLHRRRDGTVFPAEITARRHERDGRQIGIASIRDVTERQGLEALITAQRDLAVSLTQTTDLHETLRLCTLAAIEASELDCGGTYLADAATGELTLAFHSGLPPSFAESAARYTRGDPEHGLVMSGVPLYTCCGEPVRAKGLNRADGLRALAVVPIRHEDGVVGCLNVASWTHDDVPAMARVILETLAGLMGQAIARVRATVALAEREENLSALFRSVDDFLFVLDPEGRVARVNPAVEQRLGYAEEEIVGRSVLDFHPAERRDEAGAIVAGMLAGTHSRCPVPLVTREGALIPVETRVVPGSWDGRPALFGVSRDITERVLADAALRESEQRLELALTGAELGVWDWNVETGDVVFSERWAGMLGYRLDEIEPNVSSWAALLHPEDAARVMEVLEAHLEGHTPVYETEHRLRAKSGDWVWVLDRGMVIERAPDGTPLRAAGTHLDITDRVSADERRRKAEAAAQHARRLESLSVLAGGVAHNFNNLLTAVLGFAEMALDEMPPGLHAREHVQAVARAAARGAALGAKMRAYAGDTTCATRDLDLSTLACDVAASLSEERGATLAVCQDEGDPPLVRADADQIALVLRDLIENALEATADTQGDVTVRVGGIECTRAYLAETYALGFEPAEGPYAFVEVADTGCGMDEATAARAFEPFFSTKFAGRGLGLAVVAGVVRGHSGAIHLASHVGEGTTVRVLLPRLVI